MSRISQHSQQRLPANVLPGIEDPNQQTMPGQSGQPGGMGQLGQQRMGSSASGATSRVSLFKQPSFLTSPGFIPPGAPQISNPSCKYSCTYRGHNSNIGVQQLNFNCHTLIRDPLYSFGNS